MLKEKNILLISPEPWDHIFVSKHHYSINLARKGNKVFFLNPPGDRTSIMNTNFEGVYFVNYRGFPKGLRFYPVMFREFFQRNKFKALQKLCGVEFDIVWSFDNSVFFDFEAIPSTVLKLSHIVDLNQDFQTNRAARSADFCFCTTELIKNRLKKFNAKTFKINHGYNSIAQSSFDRNLPGSSKIKAVYSGNLAMKYIDWSIMAIAIRQNPDIDFVFIGPNKDASSVNEMQTKAKREVLAATNTFFTGRVSSDELIQMLAHADILLVAYLEKHHDDQANPHKMMEYLGSGKMIVATFTAEYLDLAQDEVILMSNRNSDFPQLVEKTIRDLAFWNSENKQSRRKAFAIGNSYSCQIETIEHLIFDF